MSPKNGPKERIDVLLVARGLAESREQAKRLILAGAVEIHGISIPKPGQVVDSAIPIHLKAKEKYVSRGGLKLEKAIEAFAIDVNRRVCLDVGASTGGFTDCLLQNGAAKVHAVDVGVSQMHERLKGDDRVVLHEHTNAKELQLQMFDPPPNLAAVDVSFISVTRVSEQVRRSILASGEAVILIKPQFEAGREAVSRGKGVIKDPMVHRAVIVKVLDQLSEQGWYVSGLIASPIAGGSGNKEFLSHLRATAPYEAFAWETRIAIDELL